MPLLKSKSKQAFKKNIESEMDSGKPQKQALAIAFNTQRRAGKKMAQGGMVSKGAEADNSSNIAILKENYKSRPESDYMADKASDESPEDHDSGMSIIDSIRAKRRAEMDSEVDMFAEGGKVAHGELDNEESGQAPYDEDNAEAYDRDSYDDSQLEAQPHDSNLKGDSPEMDSENKHDMALIERIRERMRNRRGF